MQTSFSTGRRRNVLDSAKTPARQDSNIQVGFSKLKSNSFPKNNLPIYQTTLCKTYKRLKPTGFSNQISPSAAGFKKLKRRRLLRKTSAIWRMKDRLRGDGRDGKRRATTSWMNSWSASATILMRARTLNTPTTTTMCRGRGLGSRGPRRGAGRVWTTFWQGLPLLIIMQSNDLHLTDLYRSPVRRRSSAWNAGWCWRTRRRRTSSGTATTWSSTSASGSRVIATASLQATGTDCDFECVEVGVERTEISRWGRAFDIGFS